MIGATWRRSRIITFPCWWPSLSRRFAGDFAHVQKLPLSYFDRNPVGRLVTRMTTDVDVLQEMFSSGVLTLLSDLIMVVWIVSIMFYLNVGLALVSLALIPPMMFAINFFRVKARQNYRRSRERSAG